MSVRHYPDIQPQRSVPMDFWNLAPESEDQPQRSEQNYVGKEILRRQQIEQPPATEQEQFTVGDVELANEIYQLFILQLEAEIPKSKIPRIESVLKQAAKRIHAALTAEREQVREWQQRFEQAAADSYAYAQQLRQALAAIAEHNRKVELSYNSKESDSELRCVKITVDLSALDKHDKEVRAKALNDGYAACAADTKGKERFLRDDEIAEVRKPLVDLEKAVRKMGESVVLHPEVIDALAKLKP